jgi:hypothetical protein
LLVKSMIDWHILFSKNKSLFLYLKKTLHKQL